MQPSRSAWFRPVRKSYLPSSWQGMIIYLIYTAYIIVLIGDWLHLGHHGWTFLVNVLPLSIAAAVLTQYIASKNS